MRRGWGVMLGVAIVAAGLAVPGDLGSLPVAAGLAVLLEECLLAHLLRALGRRFFS